VAQGETLLSPSVAAEVLALVGRGLTNRHIAAELVRSENTVRNHLSHILDKLGLSRRSQVAAYAAQGGLLDPPAPGQR
jgi:DNA-binding NarL/FixJ family response regulator